MIETTCQCGAPFSAPESCVGQTIACQSCGQPLVLVAAETLSDGAGAGDFDAHLIIEGGPDRVGQQLLLGGVPEITIGKLPERNIMLAGGSRVSRFHCTLARLDFGPSRWEIRDHNSTNGVLINGEPVSNYELQNNDLITVGDYDLRFVSSFERDLAVASAATAHAAVADASAPPLLSAAPAVGVLTYGTRAETSARLLGDCDPKWVVNLRNAASFMIWALIVNVLSSCIPRAVGIKLVIDFAMSILSWFAAWLLTEPEPGGAASSGWDMLRIALRVVASVKVVGEVVVGAGIALDLQPLRLAGALIALAFVPQLFLFLLYLSHLARRIPNKGLAINCLIVMIGLPASVATVVAAAVFIGAIGPVGHLGSGHLGLAALTALAGFGGLLVFSIWYVGLLIWFRYSFS